MTVSRSEVINTYTYYMAIILSLLLLLPAPSMSGTMDYCVEVEEILAEGVESGYINEQDAVDIMARCARAPEIQRNSP